MDECGYGWSLIFVITFHVSCVVSVGVCGFDMCVNYFLQNWELGAATEQMDDRILLRE